MSNSARELIDRHLRPHLEAGVDPSRFGPEASLREDLGLSSLDAVSLLMSLEEELDVEVSDQELGELRLLGDLVGLIEKKLAGRGAA